MLKQIISFMLKQSTMFTCNKMNKFFLVTFGTSLLNVVLSNSKFRSNYFFLVQDCVGGNINMNIIQSFVNCCCYFCCCCCCQCQVFQLFFSTKVYLCKFLFSWLCRLLIMMMMIKTDVSFPRTKKLFCFFFFFFCCSLVLVQFSFCCCCCFGL